jgi:hypothetical protein
MYEPATTCDRPMTTQPLGRVHVRGSKGIVRSVAEAPRHPPDHAFRSRHVADPIRWGSPRMSDPASISDNTLRAIGRLVAVAPLANGTNPVSLVVVEEPETALHPAASGALMVALREAAVRNAGRRDHSQRRPARPVRPRFGTAPRRPGPQRGHGDRPERIDFASREAVAEHLDSPEEWLRMDQREADPADLLRQRAPKLSAAAGASG